MMKKVLFLGVALTGLSLAKAQEGRIFKPFKVDVSSGYAIAEGSGSKGGALFVIEPKYAVIDQLAIGLRMEAAVTARGISSFNNNSGTNVNANVSANVSYLLTGDYYFSNHDFRPFAGAGVGFFTLASASVQANSSQGSSSVTTSPATTVFGGMVRVGFEARHFRFGAEYNIVGQSNASQTNGSNTTTVTSKNGYVGLKIGVCIGGGRYKR